MNPSTLADLDLRHVWHPFTQAKTAARPLAIASAKGSSLTTTDGRKLIDLISSWWVTLHGHAEPAIAQAIAAQAATLEQVIFAGFTHEPAVRLAARLAEILPGDLNRVFFSDDGSTSVEVALKLAYQYWHNRGENRRRRVLAFDGGYHGDTFGAMATGKSSGFYAPFEKLLFDVDFLPFPSTWLWDEAVARKEAECLEKLDRWLDRHGQDGAALIAEPLVQGAAGMRMCRPQFLSEAAARVRAAGMLLIFDEVMTGFGRTGVPFACGAAHVVPDIICLAKGLTGGFLPLAATVCTDRLYEGFLGDTFERAFAHGHSFTANPIGCAAALASLDLLETQATQGRIASIAAEHTTGLSMLEGRGFNRRRQAGTIAAMTLGQDAAYGADIGGKLAAFFLDRGFVVRPLGNNLYFLPPYCISADELRRAYQTALDAATQLVS